MIIHEEGAWTHGRISRMVEPILVLNDPPTNDDQIAEILVREAMGKYNPGRELKVETLSDPQGWMLPALQTFSCWDEGLAAIRKIVDIERQGWEVAHRPRANGQD